MAALIQEASQTDSASDLQSMARAMLDDMDDGQSGMAQGKDLTDGFIPDDALHVNTIGFVWSPSPNIYKGLKTTTEYIRPYEEGFENLSANDIFSIELQLSI